MKTGKRLGMFAGCLLAAALFVSCGDDGGGGSISGTVTDSSGDPVAGATVTTDPATSSATTDATGAYDISDVDDGTYVVTVDATGYVPGQASTDVSGSDETVNVTLTSQFEATADAARDFITALGTNSPAVSATSVNDNLNDGDDTNDPLIISVRSATHYDIGHVPGAINIPWRQIALDDSIAQLPTDMSADIVTYCYTGHTGQIAATALGLLGYTGARNMKWGIMDWTTDTAVRAISAFSASDENDFTVETTDNPLTVTYDPPVLDFDVETAADVVQASLALMESETNFPTPIISASDLNTNLNDGDDTNDPFIISVRSADHYDIGHIPGAHNIPWKNIADADNLQYIPTDQDIVVYCYTGHTGQVATTILNTLGYSAKNLKFGIMSWTTDDAVRVADSFLDSAGTNDFTVE